MRRLLSHFVHRLQWRLTALCVVTAVLSVTLINLVMISVALSYMLSEKAVLEEVRLDLQKSIPEATRFFSDDGACDIAQLTRWLDKQAYDMLTPHEREGWFLTIGWWSEPTALVATDLAGKVIVASPPGAGFTESKSLLEQLSPQEQTLFQSAQRGGEEVLVKKINGRVCAAVRIPRAGKPVALGFIRSSTLPTLGSAWRGVPDLLGTMVVGMGAGSVLVGGVIGSLTARRITRRLERVSGVAQQWAAGKLSASIAEGPADEIGQLERSLNQMALRLDQVFTLQNQVATLQERERITHDLHDTLKQEVFASTMLLGTAQEQLERGQLESLRASLTHLDALAEQLQISLSAILKALPFSADSQDLTELLPLWLSEWSRRSGIVASITRSAVALHLPPESLLQVRSILSEALSNIARHSHATQVTLTLLENDASITVRLSDNGRGFVSGLRSSGMGMATMRERAGALPQGSLSIQSTPGVGTDVTLTFDREAH